MKYKNFYIVDDGNNGGIFKLKVGGDKDKLVNDEDSTRKVRVVSNTSNNNSVESYIYNDNLGNKNCITIATRGNDYFSCYQDDYAVTIVRALLLYTEKFELNKYIAFYICSLLRKNAYKCNYGRVLSGERLKLEKISLPIGDNGQPNWQYIEEKSKPKYGDIINRVDKKPTKNIKICLNKDDWQGFKLSEIFHVTRGERLTRGYRIKGNTPLVTASAANNGIADFIEKKAYSKKEINKGKLTIDMFFNCFYQSGEYFSDDNVHTLHLRDEDEEYDYKFIFLFIATIFNFNGYKYAYGRQVRLHRLEEETISLPVTADGTPDWQFMEDYIKSLPYSANL